MLDQLRRPPKLTKARIEVTRRCALNRIPNPKILWSLLMTLLFSASYPQGNSSPKSITVSHELSLGKTLYRKSFALIVGINDYPNLPKRLWLQYAEDDAKDLASVLEQSYGFEAGNVKLLLGAEATKIPSSKRSVPIRIREMWVQTIE